MISKSKKVNIMIIITSNLAGGSEEYLKNLVKYFLEKDNVMIYIFIARNNNGNFWDNLSGNNKIIFKCVNTKHLSYGLLCLYWKELLFLQA